MGFLFIGIALGGLLQFFIYGYFDAFKNVNNTSEQSLVLLEKTGSFCKFLTAKSTFANTKEKLVNTLLGNKKAAIFIVPRAQIGLQPEKKIMLRNAETHARKFEHFLLTSTLSLETYTKCCDHTTDWSNCFACGGLTNVNLDAKQHVTDKIPESGLLEQARKEGLSIRQLIAFLVDNVRRTSDYLVLIVSTPKETKTIACT